MATILVVDDDPNIRYLLSQALGDRHRVIEASNGQEGLTLAEQFQPAIILTDIQLPMMTGLVMIRAIRAKNKKVKIIASATFYPHKESEVIAAGADLCLPKPVDFAQLKGVINDMVTMIG